MQSCLVVISPTLSVLYTIVLCPVIRSDEVLLCLDVQAMVERIDRMQIGYKSLRLR